MLKDPVSFVAAFDSSISPSPQNGTLPQNWARDCILEDSEWTFGRRGVGLELMAPFGRLWRASLTSARRNLCTSSSTVHFIYDAENEVPLFYENRIGRYSHEDDYNVPFEKAYWEIFKGGEISQGMLEYSVLDPLVCMAAVQSMGRMPVHRELAACTIPKLFKERKAYKIRRWRGEDFFYHDVLLRPHYLQHRLLKEAFAKNEGIVTRTRYNRLKATLDSAVIKHAVEVDLKGCRFVIFLSREEMGKKSVISKELAKLNVSVGELKLKMWRPEDEPLPQDHNPDSSKKSQWVTEEIKRRMDERLQMTHCHTRHISEVVDEHPRSYFEDYNDSELKSKERMNLASKSKIVHSHRR